MSEEICAVCGMDKGNHDAMSMNPGSSLFHSFTLKAPVGTYWSGNGWVPAERHFKVGDKVQTRDGRKARIICDDLFVSPGAERRLVVLVTVRDGGGGEVSYSYGMNGRYKSYEECQDDLVPAPNKRTVWVTWWIGGNITTASSRLLVACEPGAKTHPLGFDDGALACIKVELEEGRFDE